MIKHMVQKGGATDTHLFSINHVSTIEILDIVTCIISNNILVKYQFSHFTNDN